MKHDTYNGWTNYETWNAALWLDNDQGSYNLCNEMAQEEYDSAEEPQEPFTMLEQATSDLSDRIRRLFDDQMDDGDAPVVGWMADAINAYLSEVNWYEIAAHYMQDVE